MVVVLMIPSMALAIINNPSSKKKKKKNPASCYFVSVFSFGVSFLLPLFFF